MLDVFRFAWLAVRTFLGVVALVVALETALWVFVKIHAAAMAGVDPEAALRRVNSYNAQVRRETARGCGEGHSLASPNITEPRPPTHG
jgi:hypothetical protein